nr:protein stabilized1 [Tanacetum cinerariifolium]
MQAHAGNINARPPVNYVAGLSRGATDDEDKEADAIWEENDKWMDSRRKDIHEARLKDEIVRYPKITEQFVDLKRKLDTLSYSEWDGISEIGDYSLRNKKKRFESYRPVSDTLLEKARREKEYEFRTQDLTAVGEVRRTVLGYNLDMVFDFVFGLTVVDPKGYLTNLQTMKISNDAGISDIKKARLLSRTCIWLDCSCTIRRINPHEAKAMIARGLKGIPNSVKLWMQAATLEHDDVIKSKVLRKGLENIPDSVRLWKAVVELANEEDAKCCKTYNKPKKLAAENPI